MLDIVVATTFQQVGKTQNVTVDVSQGVFQRIAHACLRGQVDDSIKLLIGKQCLDGLAVGEICFDEGKVPVGFQQIQPSFFE